MTRITDSTTIVAAEDTLSTTLDGESVILHTGSGKYFGFNHVGTDIWELLEEPQSIEAVTQRIADDYDVTRERCRDDIDELVAELIEKQLVRVVDE